MSRGSLTIVGTGIGYWGQLTLEAKAHIEQADKVLFLVCDLLTAAEIPRLNPSAESLYCYYGDNKPRAVTYVEMAERILFLYDKT